MAQTVLERPRASGAYERVMDEVRRLGLEENLAEIEEQGFTTLRGVLRPDEIERAKGAIVARVEKASGRKVDPEAEDGGAFRGMQYVPFLLYDDPVFEEILLKDEPLALITWLLGESRLLSSMGCHFRGPGGAPLMLHSDNGNGTPAPFPDHALVANINYALTPYSREAGALAMVPGSHRLARHPTAQENFSVEGLAPAAAVARANKETLAWRDAPGVVGMGLDPGDAVVWHGSTWHGSFVRTLPGVRMNLAVYFCRQFVRPQEEHRGRTPLEVFARRQDDPRFRILMGGKQPYGWGEEGPDYSLMARNPRGLFD